MSSYVQVAVRIRHKSCANWLSHLCLMNPLRGSQTYGVEHNYQQFEQTLWLYYWS